MPKRILLLAMSFLAPCSARAFGPLAPAAAVSAGSRLVVVGRKLESFEELLDCRKNEVQHTILSCALKKNALATASSAGRRVQGAAVTLNFKGEVVNMSLEFDAGLGIEALLDDYKTALGSSPKIQYWADPSHLYASYKWIDDETEIEIARTLKGPAEGGPIRVYVSSLAGDQELSPEDVR